MATHKINISRTEAEQTHAWEKGSEEQYLDLPTEPNFADEADMCRHCSDPLSWHEQACKASTEKLTPTTPISTSQATAFTFALGSRVLPTSPSSNRTR